MMNRLTDTVKHLIIINVIMFIGTSLVGDGKLFYEWFAMYFPKNEAFQPWQIFTHMFMHGGFMHLFFNMFGLFLFGTAVEHNLGSKKFIFLYFSAGLGALLFQLGYHYYDFYTAYQGIADLNMDGELLNKIVSINAGEGNLIKGEILQRKMLPLLNEFNFNPDLIDGNAFRSLFEMNVVAQSSMVGASGCLMGVMAAFAVMNPNAELMLIFLPIPVKAKYFVPGIIILDLISAISGQSFFSPSNTAYMAHVGGAVIGFLMMWYWKKNSFNKYRIN